MFPPLLLSLGLLHDGMFYCFSLFLHVLRWLHNFSIQAQLHNWLHALTLFCWPYIFRIKITWLYGWLFWYMPIFSFQKFSWWFFIYVLWYIDLSTFFISCFYNTETLSSVFLIIMGFIKDNGDFGNWSRCILHHETSISLLRSRTEWCGLKRKCSSYVHVFESLVPHWSSCFGRLWFVDELKPC